MSWNEREDDYSSVAFWYQTGLPTFEARAPEGKDRRLPGLERVITYARDWMDEKRHGIGSAHTQQLPFYEGPQVLYQPENAEGAWFELPFEVKEKEPLRLLLNLTKSYDFGVYQAYLNGIKIGDPMDLYAAETTSEEFHLLDFWPDPGRYVLRLECVGRNRASSGYYLGIESVRLRERRPRVKEMGHDKNRDWKTDPVLYR